MENKCDNCQQPLHETKQTRVESVDGTLYVCAECAPEFQDEEREQHIIGCVCADCSGAELTATND